MSCSTPFPVPSLAHQVADGVRVAQRPLEMFFPFDPYLLKRSSRHLRLRQAYVSWRHGHPSTHLAQQGAAGGAVPPGAAAHQHAAGDGDSDAGGEEEDDSDEVRRRQRVGAAPRVVQPGVLPLPLFHARE